MRRSRWLMAGAWMAGMVAPHGVMRAQQPWREALAIPGDARVVCSTEDLGPGRGIVMRSYDVIDTSYAFGLPVRNIMTVFDTTGDLRMLMDMATPDLRHSVMVSVFKNPSGLGGTRQRMTMDSAAAADALAAGDEAGFNAATRREAPEPLNAEDMTRVARLARWLWQMDCARAEPLERPRAMTDPFFIVVLEDLPAPASATQRFVVVRDPSRDTADAIAIRPTSLDAATVNAAVGQLRVSRVADPSPSTKKLVMSTGVVTPMDSTLAARAVMMLRDAPEREVRGVGRGRTIALDLPDVAIGKLQVLIPRRGGEGEPSAAGDSVVIAIGTADQLKGYDGIVRMKVGAGERAVIVLRRDPPTELLERALADVDFVKARRAESPSGETRMMLSLQAKIPPRRTLNRDEVLAIQRALGRAKKLDVAGFGRLPGIVARVP